MEYTIKPAKIEEKEMIRRLIQPYLSELSRFPDENPDRKDENGIYVYPYLDAYWEEDSRFPYLFYADKKLAGFALVVQDKDIWIMCEFYVLPDFRRLGLGTACATEIFRKHPGEWIIGFNKQNTASRQLWKKLAQNMSHGKIMERESDISHDHLRFTV